MLQKTNLDRSFSSYLLLLLEVGGSLLLTPSLFSSSFPPLSRRSPLPSPSLPPLSSPLSLTPHNIPPHLPSPFPVLVLLLFWFSYEFYLSFLWAWSQLPLSLSHIWTSCPFSCSSPPFIILCYLLFLPPSCLTMIFHPHPILCSHLRAPIRNWIIDSLSSLISPPPTIMPDPHRDQVLCALRHNKGILHTLSLTFYP